MPSPDLIIFDCDGVLVDSEIIAARVDAALLTEAGYPVDAADVAERFSGLPFREILLEVERESGTPLSASLIERSSKELDRRLGREVRAVEGAAGQGLHEGLGLVLHPQRSQLGERGAHRRAHGGQQVR